MSTGKPNNLRNNTPLTLDTQLGRVEGIKIIKDYIGKAPFRGANRVDPASKWAICTFMKLRLPKHKSAERARRLGVSASVYLVWLKQGNAYYKSQPGLKLPTADLKMGPATVGNKAAAFNKQVSAIAKAGKAISRAMGAPTKPAASVATVRMKIPRRTPRKVAGRPQTPKPQLDFQENKSPVGLLTLHLSNARITGLTVDTAATLVRKLGKV